MIIRKAAQITFLVISLISILGLLTYAGASHAQTLDGPTSTSVLTSYETDAAVGSIVISLSERSLYYMFGPGVAIRYPVAVPRPDMTWRGEVYIAWGREWPTWTPPAAMIAREPHLEKWKDGMPGGEYNPLGARALYLYWPGGGDSLYRIHGTNNPASIGTAASSGCFRMHNADVIDLFIRVDKGAMVYVID